MTAQAVGLCRLPVPVPAPLAVLPSLFFAISPSQYSLLSVPATPDAIQRAQ